MTNPTDLRYTESHEWAKIGPDGLVWVGITDTAQELLGDLVYVGDFKVGRELEAREPAGVVESVKAASDVYAPVQGRVAAFNEALTAEPELLNRGPYDAWIFKLETTASLDGLLDWEAYERVGGGK